MTQSDNELVQKLFDSTAAGKVAWEPSGITDQFKCTFASKWVITVDKGTDENDGTTYYWLKLTDFSRGTTILQLYSPEAEGLQQLFELARRRALRIDEAISDLMRELDK